MRSYFLKVLLLFVSFVSFVLLASFSAATSSAATLVPYNESADAKADISAALAEAKAAKVPVLVVFGANWCGVFGNRDPIHVVYFKSGGTQRFIFADHYAIFFRIN